MLYDRTALECNERVEYDLVIVDDDAMFTTLLARQLRRSEKSYQIFNDSIEALCCLQEVRSCMLLIDFRMPVLDGVQLLKTLRESPHACSPDTIIYSSCLPPLDVQQTILSMQARMITKDQLLENNALLRVLETGKITGGLER